MESEWRYNAVLSGLDTEVYRLYSRITEGEYAGFYLAQTVPASGPEVATVFSQDPAFAELPIVIAILPVGEGEDYPYGFEVEPD